MKILKILLILLLSHSFTCSSQVWPKIYGGNTYNWCNQVIEKYDKGYMIDVQVDPGYQVQQRYSWIIKTDINGNQLWTKSIFSNAYQAVLESIENTPDGGVIASGATNILDPSNYDVAFIKYNACGEKEWCRIFSTPGNTEYARKVIKSGNDYIGLVAYYLTLSYDTNRIWLFKFDQEGNFIWEKWVNITADSITNEEGNSLSSIEDENFIITGDGYDASGGGPYAYLRPLIIRTDSVANVEWALPFGKNNGFRGHLATNIQQNQSGFYYLGATHFYTVPNGDSPCLLKVTPGGEESYYKDLILDSQLEPQVNAVNLQNNDSLFISMGWLDFNDIVHIAIVKTDTLGNIDKTKTLLLSADVYCGGMRSAMFSFDGNYVVAGNLNPDSTTTKIYLYKLTPNLDYAPLNTQPRIYDSLCPHPIVSDNTNLDDCAIITNVDDPFRNPEKFNLAVYPNPARDKLTIEIPGKLARKTGSGAMQITTIYHQWDKATLEIYDLSGKLVFSKEINKQTERVELNVGTWQTGMYAARLVFMNSIVAEAKFVVER